MAEPGRCAASSRFVIGQSADVVRRSFRACGRCISSHVVPPEISYRPVRLSVQPELELRQGTGERMKEYVAVS